MNLQHHGKLILLICEVNFGSVYRMWWNKKDSAASSRSSSYYMVSWVQAWRSSLSPPEVAISLSPGLILP